MQLNAEGARVLTLPPFDEDGFTQSSVGPAFTVLKVKPESEEPKVIIAFKVAQRQNRQCDADGAPFKSFSVFLTGWEQGERRNIPPPAGPFAYDTKIFAGVGTSVEEYTTGDIVLPLVDPYEQGTGLIAHIEGVEWMMGYIAMSLNQNVLPDPEINPLWDMRPMIKIIVSRNGSPTFDGAANKVLASVVRGTIYP